MQDWVQEILKEIAKEEELPTKVVERIYMNIWKVIRDSIAQGKKDDFSSTKKIRIPYFGHFGVKIQRIYNVKKKMDEKRKKLLEKGITGPLEYEKTYAERFPLKFKKKDQLEQKND